MRPIAFLATIGDTEWPTTIMSMGEQQWFFAVGAGVRKREGVSEGSAVDVRIVPDFSRLERR